MPPPEKRITGVLDFAGAFVLPPCWDLYALIRLLKTNRAEGGLSDTLRRFLIRAIQLLAAVLLAITGLGVFGAWLGLPGPFGLGAAGVLGMRVHAGPVSAVLQPGVPAVDLLRGGLWPSALLLILTLLVAGLLTLLLVGVANFLVRRFGGRAGLLGRLPGLFWVLAGMLLLLPGAAWAFALALIAQRSAIIPAELLLNVPTTGSFSFIQLLLAAVSAAFLPALITARAVTLNGAARPGLIAARTIGALSGLLVNGVIVVETIWNIPGVGRLLIESLRLGDWAVTAYLLIIFPPLLGLFQLRVLLADALLPLAESTQAGRTAAQPHLFWGLLAVVLIAALLLAVMMPTVLPGLDAAQNVTAFDAASRVHLLGADRLGRDVGGQALVLTGSFWLALGAGALTAVGLGAAWALLTTLAASRSQAAGALLGLPPLALILLHPALLALLIIGVSAGWLAGAVALGLALAPRIARMLEHAPALPLRGVAAVALLAAFQVTFMAGMLGWGADVSLGALWGPPAELLITSQLAPEAGIMRLLLRLLAISGMHTLLLLVLLRSAGVQGESTALSRALS